jgi:Flp pilus assembly protein TadG
MPQTKPGSSQTRLQRKPRRIAIGGESANSIVEVALLMPMLVLILIGTAELGRLAFAAIEVNNAAYAGAAFGSQNHGTASDSANIATAASNDGANVSGLSTSSSLSCACTNGTTVTCSNAAANCVSPARVQEFVQVSTTASVSPMFNYPGISTTWVLHGQATMRVVE